MVVLAASAARSVALAGFGLDSLSEIFVSVVVWPLTGVTLKRERLSLRLIGIAFIALVIYIAATFVAMRLLALGKRLTSNCFLLSSPRGRPVFLTRALARGCLDTIPC
jgi:hypothetical protein